MLIILFSLTPNTYILLDKLMGLNLKIIESLNECFIEDDFKKYYQLVIAFI